MGRLTEVRSQLVGAFTGYDDGALFHLSNGQVWQQSRYTYQYKYAYRPEIRIYQDQNRWLAKFDCMGEAIDVVLVNILEEGAIVSDFTGFDGSSRFEFQNGRVWGQAEYKYCSHYAYRPHAVVVDGVNGVVLHVDGMSEQVRVRRA